MQDLPTSHHSPASAGTFSIETTRCRRQVIVLSVAGDVDLSTVKQFADVVAEAMSAGDEHRVVLELNRVTFFGLLALEVVEEAWREGRRNGTDVVVVVDDVAPASSTLRFLAHPVQPLAYTTLTAAVEASVRPRAST